MDVQTLISRCDTVREILARLKKRMAPNDYISGIEARQVLRSVLSDTKSTDQLKWIDSFEAATKEAEDLEVPEEMGDNLIFCFLEAVKGWDSYLYFSWSAKHEEQVNEGKTKNVTISRLTSAYRDKVRLNRAFGKTPKPGTIATFKKAEASEATGTRSGTQSKSTWKGWDRDQKPLCVCRARHFYVECYYLNGDWRPPSWTLDPKIGQSIRKRLTEDPKWKAKVERSVKSQSTREERTLGGLKPQNLPAFTQTSFIMATVTLAPALLSDPGKEAAFPVGSGYIYPLRDSFILASAANSHVCNNFARFNPETF